jgi:hypothetical protein
LSWMSPELPLLNQRDKAVGNDRQQCRVRGTSFPFNEIA